MVYGHLRELFVESCAACSGPATTGFCGFCAAEFPRVPNPCTRCGLARPVRNCPLAVAAWHIDAVLAPFSYIKKNGGARSRDERYRMPEVADAGWHFTYQGMASTEKERADRIRKKIRSFSHQELNTPELMADGEIERRMERGMWLTQDWGEEPTVFYVALESVAPPAILALADSRPWFVKEAVAHV